MISISASHHDEWEEHSLAEYGQYSDCISECEKQEWADHTSGTWFYIPDKPLPAMKGVDYEGKTPNEWVIYGGTWGNDNSPGASHYTYAEIYDLDDPEDERLYNERIKELRDLPEWLPSEMEGDEEEEVEDAEIDEEDRPTCEKCGGPRKAFMQPGTDNTMDEVFGCPKCDS